MNGKEKGRSRCTRPKSGRGLRKGKTSTVIVRQHGYPVNGIFPCGFLQQVFDLLSEPITEEQISMLTESTIDRVRLALSDLTACGVVIRYDSI